MRDGEVYEDKRPTAERPEPSNKLTVEEYKSVLNVLTLPRYADLPPSQVANAPNQVWTWDITWLPTMVVGMYYKLYMIVDIFSRKIVGWEVYGLKKLEN